MAVTCLRTYGHARGGSHEDTNYSDTPAMSFPVLPGLLSLLSPSGQCPSPTTALTKPETLRPPSPSPWAKWSRRGGLHDTLGHIRRDRLTILWENPRVRRPRIAESESGVLIIPRVRYLWAMYR